MESRRAALACLASWTLVSAFAATPAAPEAVAISSPAGETAAAAAALSRPQGLAPAVPQALRDDFSLRLSTAPSDNQPRPTTLVIRDPKALKSGARDPGGMHWLSDNFRLFASEEDLPLLADLAPADPVPEEVADSSKVAPQQASDERWPEMPEPVGPGRDTRAGLAVGDLPALPQTAPSPGSSTRNPGRSGALPTANPLTITNPYLLPPGQARPQVVASPPPNPYLEPKP